MSLLWALTSAMAFVKVCSGGGGFCTLPKPGAQMIQRCSLNNVEMPCLVSPQQGTVVQFQCNDKFVIRDNNTDTIECVENGQWDLPIPRCVPECGKLPSAVPLIVHGTIIEVGIFPWQAAIYHNYSDGWQFACGGNLLSARIIITAAHCAWQINAKDIKVALGKRYRNENATNDTSQLIQVEEIEKLDSYQDAAGNYNGDLALLLLKEPVNISDTVAPICIDWQLKHIDKQLVEGNVGIAVGWGLTENDTFSDELRAVKLPVVSNEHCIQQELRDFKKFVTYTSFCAGYTNGTGVCNGDSGGGLSFFDPDSDTWFLQGLVSVSPRRRGTPYCDPTFFTVFTKVAMFTTWLQRMEKQEILLEQKDSLTSP